MKRRGFLASIAATPLLAVPLTTKPEAPQSRGRKLGHFTYTFGVREVVTHQPSTYVYRVQPEAFELALPPGLNPSDDDLESLFTHALIDLLQEGSA